MKLSASKAAKEAGVSIPTVTRAIKSGRLSAEPVEGGGYLIDPSELFRVFSPVSDKAPVSPKRDPSPLAAVLDLEVKMLREQLALMQQAVAAKDGVIGDRDRAIADLRGDRDQAIADLRADRDNWQAQADRMTKLLASPQTSSAQSHRPWWKRLAG